MTSPPPVRTVEIEPLSSRRETLVVLRVAAAVILIFYFLIGIRRGDGGATVGASTSSGTNPAADLYPYQVLFRDIPSADQRRFRQLQEGLAEIEIARNAAKEWPSVESLAAKGIPPFATDPLERGAYTWTYLKKSYVVNYLGTPKAGSGRKPMALLLEEPQTGNPDVSHAQMQTLDEEHRRLGDGTILHVSIWYLPEGGDSKDEILFRPAVIMKGWKQIRVGAVGGKQ